ncbi:MAG: hypothetical protein CFE21_16875 [Bacteroidetes bacterium B1(2017)]|nr:MAG: hypothetical protein CFE21_16875 [Bacteroidetes bacterium B1(2017)]
MKIVWGWNTLKIKTFEPHEVGLEKELIYGEKVEPRQEYFHLYLIPLLGVKKEWWIRGADNKLRQPSKQQLEILNSKDHKLRAPLLTYSWFWLAILIAIGANLFLRFESLKASGDNQKYHEFRADALLARLNYVKTGDLLCFEKVKTPEEIEEFKENYELGLAQKNQLLFAKVLARKGENLDLLLIPNPSTEYFYGNENLESVWKESHPETVQGTSTMEQLRASVEFNAYNFTMKQKGGTALPKQEGAYMLCFIQKTDGADFEYASGMSFSSENGGISLPLRNFGLPTTLIKIENLYGATKWTTTLPYTIGHAENSWDNSITLEGTGYDYNSKFMLMLTTQNKQNKIQKYLLKGNMEHQSIVPWPY